MPSTRVTLSPTRPSSIFRDGALIAIGSLSTQSRNPHVRISGLCSQRVVGWGAPAEVPGFRGGRSQPVSREPDGFEDLSVARASAEGSRESLADLVLGWVGEPLQ